MENVELNETYELPDNQSDNTSGNGNLFGGLFTIFGFDKIVILLVIIGTIIGVKYLTNHVTFDNYILKDNLIVEGDNGVGKLSKPYEIVDVRAFYDKYSNGSLSYPEFKKLFEVEVEGDTENMTSDTKLNFKIKLDKKKAEAAMNKKLLKTVYKFEYDRTIYDKPMINPFNYLKFTFDGTEGNVTARITPDESQSNQYGYTLKVKSEEEMSGNIKYYLEVYKGSEYINSYEIEYVVSKLYNDFSKLNNTDLKEGSAVEIHLSAKTKTEEYFLDSTCIVFVNPLDAVATEKQSINKESIEAFKAAAQEALPDGKYLHTYFFEETKSGVILVATFEEPEYNSLHIADITNPGIDENGKIQSYSLDSVETDTIYVEDFNNLDVNKELKNYYQVKTSVEDAKID